MQFCNTVNDIYVLRPRKLYANTDNWKIQKQKL